MKTKKGEAASDPLFFPSFQREEASEAARAIAGPIIGGKVAESGIERTIDGSGGLQGT